MRNTIFCMLALLSWSALPVAAQQSKMFGPYELHYSVVNTTFLEPKVAATYGITRAKNRAILNLAIREHGADGSDQARSMELKGRSWDLLQHNQELAFQEVREGPAIYYIAEVKFQNKEWRHFEIFFRPENSQQTQTFKLKHQMYSD